jgi:predicted enzyme related to lactoylglutathione lyase
MAIQRQTASNLKCPDYSQEEIKMSANNISHFDVHADDVARARKFYERVFEWRFTQWGPPDFFLIATGTDDDPGIHGAVHDRPQDGDRSVGFQCTISVDDVDAIAKLIEKEGGKIIVPKMVIPGVGELIQFSDTEGNIASAMRYFDESHGLP